MRCALLLVLTLLPLAPEAQPEALVPGVTIREVVQLSGPIRLAHDPTTDALWITGFSDELFRIDPPYSAATLTRVAPRGEHGANKVRGLAVGPDGAVYLVGNDEADLTTQGVVRRGRLVGGVWTWEDVLRTDPYAQTGGSYDHQFTAATVSPDGQWLYVASGSRTDHGEIQPASGAFPGLRDEPLTKVLYRVPADATGLSLPNDDDALDAMGVVYARGVRNAFSLAFDADGELFGIDNAGDRDDGEELNWIREGHHYGFPWRIGLHDTPQQFPGYDPDADSLVNRRSYAYRNGYFTDDPTFPTPPAGVVFAAPLVNTGPDADIYKDPASGEIRDASETGMTVASFTPHRSPLGLAFDAARGLPDPFTGDGFVASYTALTSRLLGPFGDESEDVLHVRVSPDRTSITATRIARGFAHPVDAVLVGRTLYVMESGGKAGLWALDFTDDTATEPPPGGGLWLSISPNPSRGTLRIATAPEAHIEIVDALGRVVLSGRPDAFAVWSPAPGVLAPGVYRVRASGGGEAVSRAFTVVR